MKLPAVIKSVKFPFYTEQVRVCALPVLLFQNRQRIVKLAGFAYHIFCSAVSEQRN